MDFGLKFGREMTPGTILLFYGDLAAGKTTLIKGIVAGYTGSSIDEVSSPTYSYLHIYEEKKRAYHFDLYRLNGCDEFLSMGFDEFFYKNDVCLIEWAERIHPLLPLPNAMTITLEHISEDKRKISIE